MIQFVLALAVRLLGRIPAAKRRLHRDGSAHRPGALVVVAALVATYLVFAPPQAGLANGVALQAGDVIVSVNLGTFNHFTPTGTLVDILTDGTASPIQPTAASTRLALCTQRTSGSLRSVRLALMGISFQRTPSPTRDRP